LRAWISIRSIPPTAAALVEQVSRVHSMREEWCRSLPASIVGVVGLGQLDLDAVNAVDTVNEQDQDEHKGDLEVL
jgi:hypothetical protein